MQSLVKYKLCKEQHYFPFPELLSFFSQCLVVYLYLATGLNTVYINSTKFQCTLDYFLMYLKISRTFNIVCTSETLNTI